MLLGFSFALTFRLIYLLDPASFSLQTKETWDFFYFSFTTLTTLGYGDILPVKSYTKMLANLEAITGQLFIAIFIARLMGLRMIHASNSVDGS